MGGLLDKPNTEKYLKHEEGNGIQCAVASMQGWRIKMEDNHCIKINLGSNLEEWSYFAVFDGHSGSLTSKYCAEHLLETILTEEDFLQNTETAINAGFINLDKAMRLLPEISSGEDRSGTTAVCALVSPREILIANCGDSRAVLCRSEAPYITTLDHRPRLPSERKRIIQAGARLKNGRINGRLAVSRALGDYDYKNNESVDIHEQPVTPVPDVTVVARDDALDEFLVLACDGIWNVMSDVGLCKYIHSRLLLTDDLEAIVNEVLDTCLFKNSDDNMSIILVVFAGAPKPTYEAHNAEMELNATLERLLKEVIKNNPDKDFVEILRKLKEYNIEGLPPGGGLASKGAYITGLYKDLCPEKADTAKVSRW